jgi:hypothetical protein
LVAVDWEYILLESIPSLNELSRSDSQSIVGNNSQAQLATTSQPGEDRGDNYIYLFLADYLAGLSASYYSSYYSRSSPSAVQSASKLEQSQELEAGPSVPLDDFVGNLFDYYPDTTCEDDESYLKEFPELLVNQNHSQSVTPIGGMASPSGWDGETAGASQAASLYSNISGLQRSRNRRVNQMNRSQDYRDTRYGLSIEHVLR